MINKKIGVSFVFLLSIMFLLNFVFAGNCWIESGENCEAAEGAYVILGMSDTTNAHAQTWAQRGCVGTVTPCQNVAGGIPNPVAAQAICESQLGCYWQNTQQGCQDQPGATACSELIEAQCGATTGAAQFGCGWAGQPYPWTLCCDVDPGNRVCLDPEPQTPGDAASDNVLVLSSDSNAHAEFAIEVQSAYDAAGNRICYPNIDCSSRPEGSSCSEGSVEILSLSGETNAHVGEPGTYPNKICCDVAYLGESSCEGGAPNGNWPEGSEDCDPLDLTPPTNEGCTNLCSCPTFYTSNGDGGCNWDGAGGLTSYWSPTYDDAINFRDTNEIAGLYVGQNTVYLGLIDWVDRGWTNGQIIDLEIYEDDLDFGTGWGDDPIRVGVEAIQATVIDSSIGLVVGGWIPTQSDLDRTENDYKDFYFVASDGAGEFVDQSPHLELSSVTTIVCSAIGLCMDYRNEQDCNNDANLCQVGPFSVNLNSPNVDCITNNCQCFWDTDTSTCNSMWGNDDGNCKYSEDSEDDCGDMFLTYVFTAVWETITGAPQPAECAGGENVVPCPAKVQLPFFNIYNVVAVIVIIVLIYLALNLKKKKPKSRKKK